MNRYFRFGQVRNVIFNQSAHQMAPLLLEAIGWASLPFERNCRRAEGGEVVMEGWAGERGNNMKSHSLCWMRVDTGIEPTARSLWGTKLVGATSIGRVVDRKRRFVKTRDPILGSSKRSESLV